MHRGLVIIAILMAGNLSLDKAAADQIAPHEVFARLGTLVGEWEGTSNSGRVHQASYRFTANKSVLVERWTLGPTREALTLYHMDNESLMATHYCPLGNQPRLRFKEGGKGDKFVFEFVSATNLPKPEKSHQHQFEVELLGEDSFARSETYLENDKPTTERVVYSRTAR